MKSRSWDKVLEPEEIIKVGKFPQEGDKEQISLCLIFLLSSYAIKA